MGNVLFLRTEEGQTRMCKQNARRSFPNVGCDVENKVFYNLIVTKRVGWPSYHVSVAWVGRVDLIDVCKCMYRSART